MYNDEQLRDFRRTFLQDCKPKMYRRLQRAGLLADHLQAMADLCRRRVKSLVASGTFEGQAWQWAVRTVLLEAQED